MTKQKNHWYPVMAGATRTPLRDEQRKNETPPEVNFTAAKDLQISQRKKEHKLTRNKHKSIHILKLNKARLEQEHEKLLTLQKKNGNFLPAILEDGTCRLCKKKIKYTPKEKLAMAEHLADIIMRNRKYSELSDAELR